ncbi:MAG TPA: tRNA (adenosine(37)-N6)-threonylcarbamoyltransferase complex ATPase subunit type 1 TsaE [Candidatus Saccharimonadales bacterium]|nr:tRNA (adenosine(37)-N6)-threonylcarbamoyltransferase complex ATPase subunit type 1 TsaE [Candidatus Saccharimonadales bacterium]
MMLSTVCIDSAATEQFGGKLGQNLRGGEIIELISDLGGGKTTLARGIVRGAGSTDLVSSPTFTLSNVYKTPKFQIYHFDFYRLKEPGLMEHELHGVLEDPEAVIIIEWGSVLRHILSAKRMTISLHKISDDSRELTCSYPDKLAYLVAE